jgi:hypothetical protein
MFLVLEKIHNLTKKNSENEKNMKILSFWYFGSFFGIKITKLATFRSRHFLGHQL